MKKNYFDYALSVKSSTGVCTQSTFESLIDSPEVKKTCEDIASVAVPAMTADDSIIKAWKEEIAPYKKQLPVVIPHAHFTDLWRHCETAEPSPWMSMDFDKIENPRQFWEERLLPFADELRIVLAFVSPSRRGVKIISQLPEGLTREQAQAWFAEKVGIADYDHTHDLARCVYLVPRDYILHYIPSMLFAKEVEEFHVDYVAPEEKKAETTVELVKTANGGSVAYDPERKLGDLYYRDIAERYFLQELGHQPLVGERHNALIKWTHAAATSICENDRDLLLAVTPRLDLPEDEVVSIVDAVLNYKTKNFSPLSARSLDKLIRQMQKENEDVAKNGLCETEIEKILGIEKPQPPQMPKSLPELIRLLTSNVPDVYKPAVAVQVFPPLAAHLHGVRFQYIDNSFHEAGLMSVLIGKQSIGKSCVNNPIDAITADIRQVNEKNREIARQWQKDHMKAKDGDKEPLDDSVYFPTPKLNMTDAAFTDRLRRLDINGQRSMFARLDEIELLRQTIVRGGLAPDRLICLAYDHAEYGQERVSAEAISDSAPIRWNWTASTTPTNGRAFFARSLTNGTLTRLNICTIIVEDDSYMPKFGIYDEKFAAKLKPYIERLNCATGLVRSKKVNAMMEKLRLQCVEQAKEYDEGIERDTFIDLYKRALVITFRKAMTLYIASGMKWTKSMSEFMEWSLEYDLWCKLYYFSDLIIGAYKKYDSREPMIKRTASKTARSEELLSHLPEMFTSNDVLRLKEEFEFSSPVNSIIFMLKSRGLIEKIDTKTYRKVAQS